MKKINQLSRTELKEEQVFVFRSLSADTLPVRRHGWYGEYAIHMNRDMLNDLKQSYQTGVGLLASHNNNRLPFGRSFDAVIETDRVGDKDVDTLYIDQYIVKYVEDGENKVPLRTEINGMTTEDIANHISVGHTFDTSIGFVMRDVKCSICKNDIRNYAECSHSPGKMYDVQVGDSTEKVRCDILACGGEGLENSLVYAGAVDRALIQNGKQNYSNDSGVQGDVKEEGTEFYNVDDIKKVPLGSEIYCRFSKGAGIQMFTATNERQDMEVVEMAETNKNPESTELQTTELSPMATMFSKEDYDAVMEEKLQLETKFKAMEEEFNAVKEELAGAKTQITELSAKADLAEEYRKDLIEETLSVATKARGNAFNAERFGKYLETLSDAEIKEELSSLKGEFADSVGEHRNTEAELENDDTDAVELSEEELRQEASKRAMEIFRKNGGDLIELTKTELEKIKEGK